MRVRSSVLYSDSSIPYVMSSAKSALSTLRSSTSCLKPYQFSVGCACDLYICRCLLRARLFAFCLGFVDDTLKLFPCSPTFFWTPCTLTRWLEASTATYLSIGPMFVRAESPLLPRLPCFCSSTVTSMWPSVLGCPACFRNVSALAEPVLSGS